MWQNPNRGYYKVTQNDITNNMERFRDGSMPNGILCVAANVYKYNGFKIIQGYDVDKNEGKQEQHGKYLVVQQWYSNEKTAIGYVQTGHHHQVDRRHVEELRNFCLSDGCVLGILISEGDWSQACHDISFASPRTIIPSSIDSFKNHISETLLMADFHLPKHLLVDIEDTYRSFGDTASANTYLSDIFNTYSHPRSIFEIIDQLRYSCPAGVIFSLETLAIQDDAMFHFLYGEALFKLFRPEDALSHLNTAIKMLKKGNDPNLHIVLEYAYRTLIRLICSTKGETQKKYRTDAETIYQQAVNSGINIEVIKNLSNDYKHTLNGKTASPLSPETFQERKFRDALESCLQNINVDGIRMLLENVRNRDAASGRRSDGHVFHAQLLVEFVESKLFKRIAVEKHLRGHGSPVDIVLDDAIFVEAWAGNLPIEHRMHEVMISSMAGEDVFVPDFDWYCEARKLKKKLMQLPDDACGIVICAEHTQRARLFVPYQFIKDGLDGNRCIMMLDTRRASVFCRPEFKQEYRGHARMISDALDKEIDFMEGDWSNDFNNYHKQNRSYI